MIFFTLGPFRIRLKVQILIDLEQRYFIKFGSISFDLNNKQTCENQKEILTQPKSTIMRKQTSYDYLAKLLIIGDSGVGKTNILLRFCQNNFMTSHLTTIGIDFKIKTIQVDGKKIRMQIWDTAGQERFKTITQTYYKGAMGIIMVYSTNDLQSFNALQNWMKQIKTHASENVVKVLIANKCDLPDRKVSYDQGKQLANSFGVQFFEVSAKEGKNIEQTFYYLAKQIKNKVLSNDQAMYSSTAVSKNAKIIKKPQENLNKKKGCC